VRSQELDVPQYILPQLLQGRETHMARHVGARMKMARKMSPSGKSVAGGEWLPVSSDASVGITATMLKMAGHIV